MSTFPLSRWIHRGCCACSTDGLLVSSNANAVLAAWVLGSSPRTTEGGATTGKRRAAGSKFIKSVQRFCWMWVRFTCFLRKIVCAFCWNSETSRLLPLVSPNAPSSSGLTRGPMRQALRSDAAGCSLPVSTNMGAAPPAVDPRACPVINRLKVKKIRGLGAWLCFERIF